MLVEASKLTAHFAPGPNAAPPRHLGRRYDRAGVFQPEPANTVVCHVVPGSATQQALADARARVMAMPDANRLAFTPVQSYHMTLFQGIIEDRRTLPYWPAGVATDMPIPAMTDLFLKRLETFLGGESFDVAITAAVPTGLMVDGATAADRHAMADWRNRFADVFGYRHPDHDSYGFHITMAYVIEWFDTDAMPAWETVLNEVAKDIRERAPFLQLRAPAFCSFEDMNWFEELRVFEAR